MTAVSNVSEEAFSVIELLPLVIPSLWAFLVELSKYLVAKTNPVHWHQKNLYEDNDWFCPALWCGGCTLGLCCCAQAFSSSRQAGLLSGFKGVGLFVCCGHQASGVIAGSAVLCYVGFLDWGLDQVSRHWQADS